MPGDCCTHENRSVMLEVQYNAEGILMKERPA